jgi:hypothetical protein
MSTNRPHTPDEWTLQLAEDPTLPQTADELELLRRKVLGELPLDDITPEGATTCCTTERYQFDIAIRNPHLSEADRSRLELDDPVLRDSMATDHFILLFNNGLGAGEIPQELVWLCAVELENAYNLFLKTYGTTIVKDGVKCLVYFLLEPNRSAPPGDKTPGGVIVLKCDLLLATSFNAILRRLICFHEAFHLLQFSSGILAVGCNKWFLEGTATWAEAVHASPPDQMFINGELKLTYLWTHPLTLLTATKYVSFPFWLFLTIFCPSQSGAPSLMFNLLTAMKQAPSGNCAPLMNQLRFQVKKMLGDRYSIQRLLVEFGLGMISGYWQTPRYQDKLQTFPIYDAEKGAGSDPIPIPPVAFPDGFSETLSSTTSSMVNPTDSLQASVYTIQRARFQIQGIPSNEAWYPALRVTQLMTPADKDETMYYGVYAVPGTSGRPASMAYTWMGFTNAFESSPVTNTTLYFVTAAPLIDETKPPPPAPFLYGYSAFPASMPER